MPSQSFADFLMSNASGFVDERAMLDDHERRVLDFKNRLFEITGLSVYELEGIEANVLIACVAENSKHDYEVQLHVIFGDRTTLVTNGGFSGRKNELKFLEGTQLSDADGLKKAVVGLYMASKSLLSEDNQITREFVKDALKQLGVATKSLR
ncbi:MAG: hypothetical protein UT34_C0002G0214 [candidate division WS6 bacterium GW2011_GWF2_39_15]|uniref:Uncharacterized protein n=1 Tax=candidate division WS6 bacterium GW2011_GWF2_39_15 TaxID=1619100 RepID=A0A0G0QVR6_9BACT|nr:MAG: hypothetical protein UT34_C0002G0214 [candidate division WS6 bacterium GW2011_GWF2_39_15]